ncbi:uncharacterized protein LOC134447406 [Engraulis encrasicolus]|uniref:uncharacterized protein LOC134447406 n=1 Tax=Engraulis encrasicolus TaxID=184585 RepID=UPI002FD53855
MLNYEHYLFQMFHTGAEMNPARYFTPALFKRNFMNHWVYRVGPMIRGSMGAVMYDFMLFPRICGLAERVATLKGSRPLEQDTCGEPIKLKMMSHTGAEMNPARSFTPAVFKRNFINHWMFYTGAEMNPARYFTPALFKRNFMNHWVYRVGPMICGAMGAVMYDFMFFPVFVTWPRG